MKGKSYIYTTHLLIDMRLYISSSLNQQIVVPMYHNGELVTERLMIEGLGKYSHDEQAISKMIHSVAIPTWITTGNKGYILFSHMYTTSKYMYTI